MAGICHVHDPRCDFSHQASSKSGSPDIDTLHSLLITGFQDVWKKFQSGLWVALPQHWVQGWVTANLQNMINELGSGSGMTEDMASALKTAIFLPPQAAIQDGDADPDHDRLVPTKDNAFLG